MFLKKQSTQKISNQKMKLKERDKSILEYVQCMYRERERERERERAKITSIGAWLIPGKCNSGNMFRWSVHCT